LPKRLELVEMARVIGEGKVFGGRLEEKVEGIVDGHFGHQVHLDTELVNLLREGKARHIVALRILLPIQEVV
jgi:hypothetical protein